MCTSNFKIFQSITLLEDVVMPEITESNQVKVTVRAAAIDQMDILIASGYGSFIRKFLIKNTLHVRKGIITYYM